MSINPTSPSPKLVVTSGLASWRTQELRDTDAVYRGLVGAQEQHADQVVVSGSFFQEAQETKRTGLLKKIARIAVPALTATGLLVAGAAVAPLLALGGVAGAVTAVIASAEAPRLKSAIDDYRLAAKFPEHQGLNVWRQGGPPTEVAVEHTSPPQDGLRELLVSNMRDYPNSFHVVHATGHGMGALYSAGLSGEALADAFTSATARAQDAVDVAILDSCFSANLENLARIGQQPGAVKYVVAFEDAIPNANADSGRIPLRQMISRATDADSAQQMAVSMATVAGGFFSQPNNQHISNIPLPQRLSAATLELRRQGLDSTVAAVDMETFANRLHPALDQAGLQLRQALDHPELANAIAQAKQAAEIEPAGNLVDLGNFLSGVLEKAPKGGPLRTSLQTALDSLQASLLHKRTGTTFPLSGLSFHTSESARQSGEISPAPSKPLEGDHLPQSWVAFVKKAF